MSFPRKHKKVAWFLTWFHLVPDVAEKWFPRKYKKTAWFLTWFHLVPLGSRCCRQVVSQKIQEGRLGSCLGSTWRHGNEIPLCSRLAVRKESGLRHPTDTAPAKIPS